MNETDFEQLLVDHKVPTAPPNHRHSRPGWVNFDCPLCGPNTQKFHMGYNKRAKVLNCWRCGKQDIIKIMVTLLGVTEGQARKLARGLPRVARKPSTKYYGTLKLPAGIGPLGHQHKAYLYERDLNPKQLVKLWDLRGTYQSTPGMNWRIVAPIHMRGDIISWRARSIRPEHQIRWMAAKPEEESYPASDWLYGLDYVRGSVVICEGFSDVWNVGPGAVAVGGLQWTPRQVELLSTIPIKVICFDSTPDAQRRANALGDILMGFDGVAYVVQMDAPDPGSACAQEVKRLRKAFLD